jgi:GTP-binding protein
MLVDMPGYGYAAAPKEKVAAWTALIRAYLRGRANLARVYLLLDARHAVKPADQEVLNLLDEAAVSYEIVLTKADAVKSGALTAMVDKVAAAVRRRPAAYPDVLATSARTGAGLAELRAAVARLLAEKDGGMIGDTR